MKRRRVKRRIGDVVEIRMGDGTFAYGQVLNEPLVAFFDVRANAHLTAEEVLAQPVLFSILVMNYAITDGDWKVIGHAPVPDSIDQRPPFLKKDGITGELFITYDGSEEIPVDLAGAQHLERAAVWEPEQVRERLEDHFAGRPNMWVERFKPDSGH
jgi:hypothetical protein